VTVDDALTAAVPDRPAPETIAKPDEFMVNSQILRPVYCDPHGRLWRDDLAKITLVYDPRWKIIPDPV